MASTAASKTKASATKAASSAAPATAPDTTTPPDAGPVINPVPTPTEDNAMGQSLNPDGTSTEPHVDPVGGAVLADGTTLSSEELIHAMRDPNVILTSTSQGLGFTPGASNDVTHVLRVLGPFEEPQPGDAVISASPLVIVRNEHAVPVVEPAVS